MNLIDILQPQANAAAVDAANAALDNVAQRPFSVVLSVSPETQAWVTLLLLGGLISGVILKRAA